MAIELADVPIQVVSPRGVVAHRAAPVSSATLVAAALAVAATLYLGFAVSGRQAALFLVGVAAGVVLYHAAFGFTSSWRHFVTSARGDGLRAQMLMLAVTCAVFFPLLGQGEAFGQTLRGSVSPVGVSVLAGAFLFGIGMQLGGGCASGTLYTVGGGNTRMLITLAAFIAGSVIGTAHMPWWSAQASLAPVSLIAAFGAWPALAASLALFAAIAAAQLLSAGTPNTSSLRKSVMSSWATWIHHSWGSLMKIQINAAAPISRPRVMRRGSHRVRTPS